MIHTEEMIPLWKAPETLLLRVMEEIECGKSAGGYFSWSLFHRCIFFSAVFLAAVITFVVTFGVGNNWDLMSIVERFGQQVAIGDRFISTLQAIFYNLVTHFLGQPFYLLSMLVFGLIIVIPWTGSIVVLYRLINSSPRRKYT